MRHHITPPGPELSAAETLRPQETFTAGLVGQLATQPEITGVEAYRTTETLPARAARYIYGILEPGTSRSMRPNRYDGAGYESQLSRAVKASLSLHEGRMSDGLYDAAEQAARVVAVTPANQLDHEFHYNDPRAVESIGVLRAVANNSAFITTNPGRAAALLANLGDASYAVGYDLFAAHDWKRKRDVINPRLGPQPLEALSTLVQQDALWATQVTHGLPEAKAEWPLSSLANALGALSKTSPLKTIDARLEMLARNRAAADEPKVNYALVYSFRTDIEQEALRARLADPQTPVVTQQVIRDILSGYWKNVAWAI